MVVGARRLEEQPPQEAIRWVRQLQELEHGHDPEHVAEDCEAADGQDDRQDRVHQADRTELRDRRDVALLEQAERGDHREIRHRQRGEDADEGIEPLGARDRQQGCQAAREHEDRAAPGLSRFMTPARTARAPAIAIPAELRSRMPISSTVADGRHGEGPQRAVRGDADRDG